MSKLISDNAKPEVRNRAHIIIWALFVDDWQSEPHSRHQNFSEHWYQKINHLTNTIIDNMSAPDYTYIIDLIYVWFLLNHTYASGVHGMTITKSTGFITDISSLLRFSFGNQYITRLMNPIYPQIVLKNVPIELASQNILNIIWHLRPLIIPLIRYY